MSEQEQKDKAAGQPPMLAPLDATKVWPEEQFPLLAVGRLVRVKNPTNYFAEVEQVAFGTVHRTKAEADEYERTHHH
jgi:catalase